LLSQFYISLIALILNSSFSLLDIFLFLILTPFNGTEMAFYVLMCHKETAHSLTLSNQQRQSTWAMGCESAENWQLP